MDTYKEWLKGLGIDLPDRRLDRLASKVAQELDLRVGGYITDQLSDEQLAEFDEVMEEANRKQMAWLEEHYPDYASVTVEQQKLLLEELKKAKNPAMLIKRWHQALSL